MEPSWPILLFQYTLKCPGDRQKVGEEPASEPPLHSDLLQAPSALQGWDGWAKILKDDIISTVVVVHRAGSITGFNNWRLTFSKTPLITSETKHMESKGYIAYLPQKHTECSSSGDVCALMSLQLTLRVPLPPPPDHGCIRENLLGWPFRFWSLEVISSGCTMCLLSVC